MEGENTRVQPARYQVLSEITALVAGTPAFPDLLDELVGKVRGVLVFDRCTLALLDGDRGTYRLQALSEARAGVSAVAEAAVPLDQGVPGAVMRSRQVRLITDLDGAREELSPVTAAGLGSVGDLRPSLRV